VRMSRPVQTVRLKVSPQVARLVGREASAETQLQAARGELALADKDLVTMLLLLCHRGAAEVKARAAETLKELSAVRVARVMREAELPTQLFVTLCRLRPDDAQVLDAALQNPHVGEEMQKRVENGELGTGSKEPAAEEAQDEENLSKYQRLLEMGVAEKIKMALSGDKEWRGLLIKDANKLVCSAVLKNPRITEGEVLTVAKNRSTSEELIRLITLNREWVKNYEIRRALVMHPRTPLPKALRYMNTLGEKDIKFLAKSRNVSQIIVNNARRMLMAKAKK
jgi:hypothetical protein